MFQEVCLFMKLLPFFRVFVVGKKTNPPAFFVTAGWMNCTETWSSDELGRSWSIQSVGGMKFSGCAFFPNSNSFGVSLIQIQSTENDPSCCCCWGILWVCFFCVFFLTSPKNRGFVGNLLLSRNHGCWSIWLEIVEGLSGNTLVESSFVFVTLLEFITLGL